MGTSAFARWNTPPVSRSAPLAFWAFIILSISSMRVGIKRRARVIIMASVCTFILNILRGESTRSRASVSMVGVVV